MVVRFLAFAAALCAAPLASAQTIVLEHANVLDGVSSRPVRDATIVVTDGRIVSVGRAPRDLPADATRIDVEGRWVIPGLIDAHVHPTSIGDAQNMLAAGVTTARSMLTDHFVDVGLAHLHERGARDIAEILPAGYPIVPNISAFVPDLGGVFLDAPELSDLRGQDLGVEGVRRLVRLNLARGATVIKVFATDRAGVMSSDPRRRLLSDEELAAAVEEARAGGAQVGAHAHGDDGAAAAVRAGVNTIDHGVFLSDDTLRLMRQRGVCYVPTMATMTLGLTPTNPNATQAGQAMRGRALLPRSRETVRHALALGVTVIAGTDSYYASDYPQRIADEMEQLASVGMSNADVLAAATSRAASCLAIGDRTGALRPGLEADITVIEMNPLENISAVRDVTLVINDGVVAIDRRVR